ncbi:MAG: hypothetical protein PHC38_10505 [Weeksellaceae bacterium]|nr:hypothetical protein [Weeksellaceae bacterium]
MVHLESENTRPVQGQTIFGFPNMVNCNIKMFKQLLMSPKPDGYGIPYRTNRDGWNILLISKVEYIIFYWENNQLIFANLSEVGNHVTIDGNRYVSVKAKYTAKFSNNKPNMAKEAYVTLAKEVDVGVSVIVGDCDQSEDPKGMWLKWITNPSKYGWEDGFILDTKINRSIKSEDYSMYWGDGEIYKRYVPAVKVKQQ